MLDAYSHITKEYRKKQLTLSTNIFVNNKTFHTMPLAKGQTNNPSGRPLGSKNKATRDLRQWLTNFIEANTTIIESDWKSLQPRERIMAFQQLLKYCLPTMQAINVNAEIDRKVETLSDDQLKELAQKILEVSHNENF
jgi:hypothetical protein